MRRCTWIMAGLLALVMEARSEVVVAYNGVAPSDNPNNLLDNSAGVTFTTSGSSAGSGRWALTNFGFNVFTTGQSFTLTGATVSLFRDSTSSGDYTYVGGQTISGLTVSSSSLSPVAVNLALSGGVFGTVGNESSGLVAGGKYLLTVDNLTYSVPFGGVDGVFGASASASTGPWSETPIASYQGTVINDAGGYDFPSSGIVTAGDLSGVPPFSTNFYTELTAVAVPEPGTLILGTIAAATGAAGAWWKRRRKNRANMVATVAEEATTV